MFKAGVHRPLIPLIDVKGKAAKTLPEQIVATGLKVGVTLALTVTVLVELVLAQPPVPVTV